MEPEPISTEIMNKEKMIIRLRSHTHSFRCENRPLVNGPGGYSATDYLRIGLPVKQAYLAISIIVICLIYGIPIVMGTGG